MTCLIYQGRWKTFLWGRLMLQGYLYVTRHMDIMHTHLCCCFFMCFTHTSSGKWMWVQTPPEVAVSCCEFWSFLTLFTIRWMTRQKILHISNAYIAGSPEGLVLHSNLLCFGITKSCRQGEAEVSHSLCLLEGLASEEGQLEVRCTQLNECDRNFPS